MLDGSQERSSGHLGETQQACLQRVLDQTGQSKLRCFSFKIFFWRMGMIMPRAIWIVSQIVELFLK